jgi:hypothetical protein
MEQWEYRVLSFGGMLKEAKAGDMEAALNEAGQEGWEAVSGMNYGGSGRVFVLLKRRVGAASSSKPDGDTWRRW